MPDLAINTIIYIILILFPGVVIKRFYFYGSFGKQFRSGLFADRIISTIFWGIICQLMVMYLFSYTPWAENNISNSLRKTITNKELPALTQDNIEFYLIYLMATLMIAAIMGSLAYSMVRNLRLDLIFPPLKFQNQWDYFITGDILKTRRYKKIIPKKGGLLTRVDVVVDMLNGKNKLFSGILTDYLINKNTGELEHLFLTDISKYSQKSIKKFEHDIFVIPYKHIINLNIRYSPKIKTNNTKRIKKDIASIISYILIILTMVIPWFIAKDVNIFSVIGAIILSLVSLLLIYTFIFSLSKENKNKLKFTGRLILILLILLTISISIKLLGYSYQDLISYIHCFK